MLLITYIFIKTAEDTLTMKQGDQKHAKKSKKIPKAKIKVHIKKWVWSCKISCMYSTKRETQVSQSLEQLQPLDIFLLNSVDTALSYTKIEIILTSFFVSLLSFLNLSNNNWIRNIVSQVLS